MVSDRFETWDVSEFDQSGMQTGDLLDAVEVLQPQPVEDLHLIGPTAQTVLGAVSEGSVDEPAVAS